ncbi:MAG: VWA domain-containing protein [Chloroflexota bacterium]
MTFIWPYLLISLLGVPFLIGAYFRLLQKRRQRLADLGPLGIVQTQSGATVGRRRHIPPLLFLIGISLLLFSLARPEMMVNLPRLEGTVIIIFDVSSSMMADDLNPTRIDAAKAAAQAFIENQPSTIQIGIVAFGNGGLIVQPPTYERGEALATIDRLSTQGGTSLAEGIFTALAAIAGEGFVIEGDATEASSATIDIGYNPSSVILMLSDGENTNETDPLPMAEIAANAGVRIYPVGVGTSDGAIIEVDGFSILTQLNEGVLQEIANLTNGTYYHADDAEALEDIYQTIDLQLTVQGDTMEITAILAGISLLLMIVGGSLSMFWFGRIP